MGMYNKLFTGILDSSVWLESDATRLVWLTCLAAMDETGFVKAAAVGNLANRARVEVEAARQAIQRLENPDTESSDPENEGRRLERVPGGWIVLNAVKFNQLATRIMLQEQNRLRVAKHRAKHPITVTASNAEVMVGNAGVTGGNENVMPSDTDTTTRREESDPIVVAKNHERTAESRSDVNRSPSTGTDHGIKEQAPNKQSHPNPAPKTAPPSHITNTEELEHAVTASVKSFPRTPVAFPPRRSPPAPDPGPPAAPKEIQTRLAEFAHAVIYDLGVPVELRADALKGMCRQFGVPYDSLSIHQALDAHRITLAPKETEPSP